VVVDAEMYRFAISGFVVSSHPAYWKPAPERLKWAPFLNIALSSSPSIALAESLVTISTPPLKLFQLISLLPPDIGN
jgi:hypothetical protein